MNYTEIVDEIFDTIKQLIRTNSKLVKSLDDNYKKGILYYIGMVPKEYEGYIITTYAVVKEYIKCVDIHKFLETTAKFNMIQLQIDSKTLIGGFILDNFSDPTVKRFVSEIINKLDRIFICINYVFAHPKEILKNATIFDTIEDIF